MKTLTIGKLVRGAMGALAIASLAASAHAGVTLIFFEAGTSGNITGPGFTGPIPFVEDANGTISWSIPGVGDGVVPYTGDATANSLEFIFGGGGSINVPSIATGNTDLCEGGTTGGTTMCAGDSHWTVTDVSADSILFTAPAGGDLTPGEDFFVNIFFNGHAPANAFGSFTTVPEPATWALFIAGFGLTGFALRRRYRLATTA